MTQTRTWASGERVVHTGKPEWGTGLITAAGKSSHDGQPCQMLTIRFERAGLKTISTAFALLIPAEQAPSLPASSPLGEAPPAPERSGSRFRIHDDSTQAALHDKLSGAADIRERMSKLPDDATDPFASPASRLKATLALYRFTHQGGSLLDWAAIQSGLGDPLSRFNRHELEKFFEAFVVVRDAHLKKTVQEVRKQDPASPQQIAGALGAFAQQALRRVDTGR